jgi:hypothetical protein
MDKILKQANTNFKMRDKTLSFFGKNQYGDWKIILFIFFVGFVLAIAFGFYSFLNMEDDVDFYSSSSSVVSNKKIKKETLISIISRMEERQVKFYDLKSNKPSVGDPGV